LKWTRSTLCTVVSVTENTIALERKTKIQKTEGKKMVGINGKMQHLSNFTLAYGNKLANKPTNKLIKKASK
jgi:hypothetical protein